jgi:glycosyltransferase involved in cell wall biosynthesis
MTEAAGVAWHVGRQGDVAGGMTQVVNAYAHWPFQRLSVRVIRSRDGTRGWRALSLFLRAGWQLLVQLRDRQREMVVVHLSQRGSFVREGLLLWLSHLRGFGTVAHLHGSSFVAFAARWPRLARSVLRAADRIIVLSEASRAAAAALVGPARVQLVPNAVPAGNPVTKERWVVFGGAVGHRKGVDVLVEAWRRTVPHGDWRLVVAGPILEPDVVPPDLPDATFSGSLAHHELMSWLDRSMIAVLPSRDEAMPMFILEAMARSNCVVSTRVGGIPAVLADGRGALVPAGDVDALADALGRAMHDDAWRRETAARGHAAFEAEFSAAAVYPRVEAIWAETLQPLEGRRG